MGSSSTLRTWLYATVTGRAASRYASPRPEKLTVRSERSTFGGSIDEKKTYDFSRAQPNPYVKRLKKKVTIRLDPGVLAYFQGLAEGLGIPYQTLVNLFLKECPAANKRPTMTWRPAAKTA